MKKHFHPSSFFSACLRMCAWLIFASFHLLSQLDAAEGLWDENFDQGITVDLRSPSFSEGVLKTEEGGVISGPNIRIQAKKIAYTRKLVDEQPIFTVEAEQDVMFELGEYLFIGKRLEYNFITKTGVIYEGRSGIEPWYFGGERIELNADGSYKIYQGFLTTSENYDRDWEISSDETLLTENKYIDAKNVQFRFAKIPFFWIPSFKLNLDTIFDNPLDYTVQWGGRQRTRFSMSYEMFSWNRFQAFLQLDYRIKRGFGGGVKTGYISEDGKEELATINYLAKDSSVDDPHQRTRHRFQGVYHNLIDEDRLSVGLSYDKLSDQEMATDYNDEGLQLDTAGRTQLQLRRQDENWIINSLTRVRVNGFQTLKQELPTLAASLKPFELGRTGIMSESQFQASYLDFEYSNQMEFARGYQSSRFEFSERLYRPFHLDAMTVTPEIGGIGILYGNSPENDAKMQGAGLFGCEVDARFYRFYEGIKHVVRPYARYDYLTYPSVSPDDVYIFDIEDGLYRLNMLRFGFMNSFYFNHPSVCFYRYLTAEVYANAFFRTQTLPYQVPKIYAKMTWNSYETLRHVLATAWDAQHGELDHFNFRTEWTISENAACAAEYRHRDSYDWRKMDHTNFILDSYRTEEALLHSQLSDKRDTLLLHLFYRWHPNWAVEFECRHGWNRVREPQYTEYEVDIIAALRSAWNVKLSIQHKENEGREDRIAVYFFVGLQRPNEDKGRRVPMCVEF